MAIIKFNEGTIEDPKIIGTQEESDYIILEGGVYILQDKVIINECRGIS